tara:strand:- start:8751 stop:9743 length:993 start_codon:yes stop_codon:yes gene_type:complete
MNTSSKIKKDRGLTLRIASTISILCCVYLFFIALLFWAGINPVLIFIFAIIMVAFQYFGSSKLVLMTTGARIITPQEEPNLHSMIENLSLRAGIPKPKNIAIIDTDTPNAFATGRNPKNAVIAVTKGLLDRLSEKEQEAVLAHEVSHIKNKDVMIITWASLIIIVSGFLIQMLFWMSLFGGFGGRQRQQSGQVFLIMMAVYLGTIAVYFISQMLILTISRYREYLADHGSAEITQNPKHLASALLKISTHIEKTPEKKLRKIEHANAFFTVNALKGKGMSSLFASHPPIEKRIDRLKKLQKEIDKPSKFGGQSSQSIKYSKYTGEKSTNR